MALVGDLQLADTAPVICERLHPRTLSRFVRRLEKKAEVLIAELNSICTSLDAALDSRDIGLCPSASALERLWGCCGMLRRLVEQNRTLDKGLNRLELAAAELARHSGKDLFQ